MRNRLLYFMTQPGMIMLIVILPVLALFANNGMPQILHLLGIGSGQPFIAPARPPDLAVVTFVGPPSIQPGEDIGSQINLAIRNVGGREARDVVIDIYFSNNGQSDTSELLLEGGRVNVTIPLIAPGQQVSVPLAGIRLPLSQSSDNPYLKVSLDPFDSIPETDESNNIAIFSIQTITGL